MTRMIGFSAAAVALVLTLTGSGFVGAGGADIRPERLLAQSGHQGHKPQHGGAAGPAAEDSRVFRIGDLVIEGPWSRATPGGAAIAAGYMRITNRGAAPDRLVAGSLSSAAGFELHETTTTEGVARMRPLSRGIEIAPGATAELKPGGVHAMFTGLSAGLAEGQTIAGTLTFERAGTVEVMFRVRGIGATGAGEHRH